MYYEMKVKYSDKRKRKSGLYVVKAQSFGSAEGLAMEEISGLIEITAIKMVNYTAKYEDDKAEKGKFFVAEIKDSTIEEKPVVDTYLVFAGSVKDALSLISEGEHIAIEDNVKSVKETKIIDVIE